MTQHSNAPQQQPLIQAQSLVKAFGSHVIVDNVSLHVKRGEVLGFLGPNGAGKSTTMRLLTGFLQPDSGSINICGYDLAQDPIAAKSHIGYLPEGSPLFSDMTAKQFLHFIASARNMESATLRSRFDWVVQTLGLEQVLHQALDTLSKGYRRRVGLAQALIHNPDVLILDEPTDGLDPMQKHEVRGLIKGLAKDKSIIISTHILEEVEPVCSRVLIINKGKTLCDMLPSELIARSHTHNAIELSLAQPYDSTQVIASLRSLQDVAEVNYAQSTGNEQGRFTLIPKRGVNLTEGVSRVCQNANWRILSLSLHQGQIDEVFRNLVKNADATNRKVA